jgi:hypothetical protein
VIRRLGRGPQAFWLVRAAAAGVAACAVAPWATVPGHVVRGVQDSGRITLAAAAVGLAVPALAGVLPAAAIEAALGATCVAVAAASRTPYGAPAVTLTMLLGLVWAGAAAWGARVVVLDRRRAAAVTPDAPPAGGARAAPPGSPARPR